MGALETGKTLVVFGTETAIGLKDRPIVHAAIDRLPDLVTLPARLTFALAKMATAKLAESVGSDRAMTNVIDVWQKPWIDDVEQQFEDAKRDGDLSRVSELKCVRECLRICAPGCPQAMEELDAEMATPPDEEVIEQVLSEIGKTNI